MPNVKSAGVTQVQSCNILVSELFKQTVKVNNVSRMTVTPANEQVTANNNAITVDISSVIQPNNETGILYMNANEFFHSFYINLIRYSENGIESDIKALSESNITAKYSVDSSVSDSSSNCEDIDLNLEDNYLNIQTFPGSRSSEMIGKLKTGDKQFTVYSRITMTFDTEELDEEFPERASGELYGVSVQAASNLAYDTATLSYTSMTERYPTDSHRYYIETVPSATLRYTSKTDDSEYYDEIGRDSKNQSTLGVNGSSTNDAGRTSMPVNTEAFYNVQSLSKASEASKLYLTFALSKKTDTGDPITGVSYKQISDMRDYLDDTITFKSGTEEKTVKLSENVRTLTNGTKTVDYVTVVLDAAKCSPKSNIYDIVISFDAKSGTGFTDYANYRVDLKAELYKSVNNSDTNIENSVAQDYLIYTNAKINPDYLSKPEESTP